MVTTKQAELLEKTKDAIRNLTEEQIKELLVLKWIRPITDAIDALPVFELQDFNNAIEALKNKYATPFSDIEQSIIESSSELSTLIDQLTGNNAAVLGLQGFKNAIK